MDILAQKRMLCALAAACLLICALAGAAGPPDGYGFSALDYFGSPTMAAAEQPEFSSGDLWNEVRDLPGGGIKVYRPPDPVLDLLQAPTLEAGRRYLRWNELRLEKIDQAQQVLEELSLGK